MTIAVNRNLSNCEYSPKKKRKKERKEEKKIFPKIFVSGYIRNCLNCDSLRWSHTRFQRFCYYGLYFEFPDSREHFVVKRARYYKTRHCFYYAICAEFLPNQFVRRQRKCFYLTPKCFLLKTQISSESLREWSILALRIAKFGPLREPIRMLLSTMDQFSHIINRYY